MVQVAMSVQDMFLFAAINSTVYLGLKALYARIWNGGPK